MKHDRCPRQKMVPFATELSDLVEMTGHDEVAHVFFWHLRDQKHRLVDDKVSTSKSYFLERKPRLQLWALQPWQPRTKESVARHSPVQTQAEHKDLESVRPNYKKWWKILVVPRKMDRLDQLNHIYSLWFEDVRSEVGTKADPPI